VIIGRVTNARRALIPLRLISQTGEQHTIDLILDTGFTGHLALPPNHIRKLGLVLTGERTVNLAAGNPIRVSVGRVGLIWRDREMDVPLLQSGTQPLLGMALLWGNRITIDAIEDGAVSIVPMPATA
jgi:clan AA aspartic protease